MQSINSNPKKMMKCSVNVLSILLILFCQSSCNSGASNCSKYKNGYFGYANSDGEFGADTVIYRKEEYQIEYIFSTETWLLLDVEWLTACEYSLKPLGTNDSEAPITKGGLKIEMTSIDSTGYEIFYDLPKENKYVASKIYNIEPSLNKSQKAQIEKAFSSAILETK